MFGHMQEDTLLHMVDSQLHLSVMAYLEDTLQS